MISLLLLPIALFMLGGAVALLVIAVRKQRASAKKSEEDNIVAITVADGVFTNNEREAIRQIATDNNLNFDNMVSHIEQEIAQSQTESETELIDYNKKNGDDFEKFVAQKFNRQFFTITEWAGDKYINGIYAKTTEYPDILLRFKLHGHSCELAVECKWRSGFYNDGIEFATPEQLQRYKQFADTKNIAVFVAIGVGGKGISPQWLFVVPLDKIDTNFIHINQLRKFEKSPDTDFFFNIETHELK